MPKDLPQNPSLRQLRVRAKELLKAQRAGDLDACRRLMVLHRFRKASPSQIAGARLALWEAQLALAIEYGFQCWSDLVRAANLMRQSLAHRAGVVGALCVSASIAATLSGTVTYPDGSVAAGVRVEAMARKPATPLDQIWYETATDEKGAYAIECTAGRFYFVRALELKRMMVSSGRRATGVEIFVPDQGATLVLKLEPRSITRVQVETEDHVAQVNGTVWASLAGIYQRYYRTPFYIDGLPEGRNQIAVREAAHREVNTEFEVRSGRLNEATVRFGKGGTVEGITVDENGNPVAGVLLYLGDRGSCQSGPDGHFRVLDLSELGVKGGRAAAFPISVRHPPYLNMNVEVRPEHRSDGLRIVLRRSNRSISGRVVNPVKDTLEAPWVSCFPQRAEEQGMALGEWTLGAFPGPDGKFTIAGVDTGVYRVFVMAPKRTTVALLTPAKANVDLGDIALPPEGVVQGRVIAEETGEPVREYSIGIVTTGRPIISKVENDSGEFRITAYYHGVNRCFIRAPGYLTLNGELVFPAGKEPAHTFCLKRSALLRVSIVSRGAPLQNASFVLLTPGWVTKPLRGDVTDSTGMVEFDDLQAGLFDYRVAAVEQGCVTVQGRVAVDTATDLKIEMQKGLTVEGTVEEADGKPCSNLLVAVLPDPRDPPPSSFFHSRPAAVEDGSFILNCLPTTGKISLQILDAKQEIAGWTPVHRVDNVAPGTRGLRIVLGARRAIRIRALRNGVLVTDPLRLRTDACGDSAAEGYDGRHAYDENLPLKGFVGEYVLEARVGLTYHIRIDGPSVAPCERVVCPGPGSDTLVVDFELNEGRRLDGIVEGRLHKETLIAVVPGGLVPQYRPVPAQVDTNGRFTLHSVPTGQFPLLLVEQKANRTVYAGLHTATRGKPVRIRMLQGARISGTVRNSGCLPAHERSVILALRQWPGVAVFNESIGAGGAFTIENVPPGNYLLSVGRERTCAAIHVTQGKPVACSLGLPDSVSFPCFRLPVESQRVRGSIAWIRGLNRVLSQADQDGLSRSASGSSYGLNDLTRTVEIGPVPAGAGEVQGILQTASPAACSVIRSREKAVKGFPRIDIRPLETRVAVTCRDNSGAAVERTRVFVSKVGASAGFAFGAKGTPDDRHLLTNHAGELFEVAAYTDVSGTLQIQGLAEGEWRLSTLHPTMAALPCTVAVRKDTAVPVTVTMVRSGGARIRAVQADGASIPNFRCRVLDASGALVGELSASGLPGGSPAVQFALSAGLYQVVVDAQAMTTGVERLEVSGKGLSAKSIVLRPCGWLEIAGLTVMPDTLLQEGPGQIRYRLPHVTGGSVIAASADRVTSLLVSGLDPGEYKVVSGSGRAGARIAIGEVTTVELNRSAPTDIRRSPPDTPR